MTTETTREAVLAKVRQDVEQANGGDSPEPLTMPADEFGAVKAVARAFGAAATKPCGCGPDEPCDTHAEKDAPQALPLDREDLRRIVRDAVANWWSTPPSEKITEALWPLLEHAQSAAAGSHEGVRMWMLDCGNLVQKHRDRADAAEAKLERIAQVCREHLPRVAAEDVLGIIGDEVA